MKRSLLACIVAVLAACSGNPSPMVGEEATATPEAPPVATREAPPSPAPAPPPPVAAPAPPPPAADDSGSGHGFRIPERVAREAPLPRIQPSERRRDELLMRRAEIEDIQPAAGPAPVIETAEEAMDSWPFADQLSRASMAFTTPETIELGESADMQLIIDPTQTAEAVARSLSVDGARVAATVLVSKVVVARVIAPDFEVTEFIRRGRQALDPSGPTEWRWTISPKTKGDLAINVTVLAVIELGSDRAEKLVKVFDRQVKVTVTPANAVKAFVKDNWQWLWSVIVPFLIWLFMRNRKKEKTDD